MYPKITRTLLVLAALALIVTPAWATNYDKRSGSAANALGGTTGRLHKIEKTIDFSKDNSGAADTFQLIHIPADTLVLAVSARVITATSGTCTIDVGDSADADGYLDGFDANTASNAQASCESFGHRQTAQVSVYDMDTTVSQTAIQFGLEPTTDVGGLMKGIVMPTAGSVVGISVLSGTACTSGTLTADATIDGTATGLQAGLESVTNTTENQNTQARGLDTFAAGALIGAEVTTSANWAPTSADTCVTVICDLDGPTNSVEFSSGKYYNSTDYIVALVNNATTTGKVEFTVLAASGVK